MDDTFKYTELKHAGGEPMPDQPELLPCPFCGQMPELEREFDYVSIGCGNPNCKMDNVDVFCQDQPNDLITAIAAWNTRADRWIPVSERLPEVDMRTIEEKGQYSLWENECFGLCGV